MKRRSFITVLLGGLAAIPFLKSLVALASAVRWAGPVILPESLTVNTPPSGITAWWDADDLREGDTVWKDRSGNGHDLTRPDHQLIITPADGMPYQVEVWADEKRGAEGRLLRTFPTSQPYTAAMQIEDFGSPQTSVILTIKPV